MYEGGRGLNKKGLKSGQKCYRIGNGFLPETYIKLKLPNETRMKNTTHAIHREFFNDKFLQFKVVTVKHRFR